jgi:hypothetical protein
MESCTRVNYFVIKFARYSFPMLHEIPANEGTGMQHVICYYYILNPRS